MGDWEVEGSEAFDALADDRERSNALLQELVDHLGFEGPWSRPVRGSALLARGTHEVLKLMAPHDAAYLNTEAVCLEALEGQLPLPTARLLARGVYRGWPWVRMSRLAGDELFDVWPTLAQDERIALATQLGTCIGVLQRLPLPEGLPRMDWEAWLLERVPLLEARHRARGAPEALLQGLEAFVRDAGLQEGRRGWLHTELMLEHLLVQRTARGWRLSGLFDFEPSWAGPVDYEFSSVGLFVGRGDPAILGAVMHAAGVEASPQRLFAMAMLHRYSNLGWYHSRLGGPLDLEGLAEAWFGH